MRLTTDNRGDTGPVELEFFARPEYLAGVRKFIERSADGSHLSRDDLEDFLTAVDEAAANAIRHGSPNGPESRIRVVSQASPGGLTVRVTDQGKGFIVPETPRMPGPDALGGRGLPLMCAMADSVEIVSTSRGTTITLKKFSEPQTEGE